MANVTADYKDGYADGWEDGVESGQKQGRRTVVEAIRVLAARSRKQAETAIEAGKDGSARFLNTQASEYDTLADILENE
jgi:flagellar biosynthesis/type III secretory pathway protein FliH